MSESSRSGQLPSNAKTRRDARREKRGLRAPRAAAGALDRPLEAPENFINRELSWLEFDARVLAQALDAETPLLERLKFLAISASNLDEFFMVRVGGLQTLAAAGSDSRCAAGLSPRRQLDEISRRVRRLVEQQYACLNRTLLPALARRGIARVRPDALDREQHAVVERQFSEELFPALTPVAVDPAAPFPRLPGGALHLAVRLAREGARRRDEPKLALLPIPRAWPRLLQLPSEHGYRYALLEEVIRHFAARFFEGYEVLESAAFRVTRNADLPVDDEEVDDLLDAMQEVLQARKTGEPVRLEIEAHASRELVAQLTRGVEIDADRLFLVDGPIDLKPFMKLASRRDAPDLRYPPFEPQPVAALEEAESAWEALRERDVLLHHPYDSFAHVVDLLRAAADDPQVVAIKQTLYRTSEESPIIAALERAALCGKQVTVLVELKARFDEERNIGWARRLDDAGAQVVWGVAGLKTHAKLLVIVRREADGVRRYVHLSTGNYNDVTARGYEDVGLLTCDPAFGADASNFFNAVTGYSEPREWREVVIAPTGLRERLYALIDREIARSTPEAPGQITLKLNSLADPEMAVRLYRASRAGVRVRLCVRGVCCLRPGIEGLSENIQVVSIVDRFLEHSRIFYFRNGGDEELYLSSADLMRRNLDRRLELLFPVHDEGHRARLMRVLETVFGDDRHAWRLRSDGGYERVAPSRGQAPKGAQESFISEALARAEATRARRLSTFRPAGPGMAPGLRR